MSLPPPPPPRFGDTDQDSNGDALEATDQDSNGDALEAGADPKDFARAANAECSCDAEAPEFSGSAQDADSPTETATLADMHYTKDRPTAAAADYAEEAYVRDDVNIALLRETPFLNPLLNETYLYLTPKDHKTLFAIWEVGQATRDELKKRYGDDFFNKNRLIMRIYQVTGLQFDGFNAKHVFEVDDFLADKNDYWLTVLPDNDYIAEIGYRAQATTYFEVVARSHSVFAPKDYRTDNDRFPGWAEIRVENPAHEVQIESNAWRFNQYHYWRNRTHAAPEEKGFWSLVLHNHLPFVHHPEYAVPLEEQWFYEAVTSVYTQLLHLFWRLESDKIDFRLTISLTPSLTCMMRNHELQKRAMRHIRECIALATKERDHSAGKPWRNTIEQTLHRFWVALEIMDSYDGDLTRGFRDFQNLGKIEIITCAATHFLLPLWTGFPETIRAQLATAKQLYERVFDRQPRGIWLPENAFTPGIDKYLAEAGLQWCLLPSHCLNQGDSRCWHNTQAPIITPNGVACFGIDEDTRAAVWSREGGYPGNPNYKEWYRDLGYDAAWEWLPPYFKIANVRRNTGIKYHRITGKQLELGQKDYYNPLWAEGASNEQAGQFVFHRGAQANHLLRQNKRKSCTVSAYDAELFGHWWEEGPHWLETVFRKMLYDQQEVRPVLLSEYLNEQPRHQRLMPGAGSWGKKNYFQTWVDGRQYQPNVWMYRHLFRLAGRMTEAAERFKNCTDPLALRALNQAARCFFLAGASDWGFLIETGQAVTYSELQVTKHLVRAKELLRQVEQGQVNEEYLQTIETADDIFPFTEMDFHVFCKP